MSEDLLNLTQRAQALNRQQDSYNSLVSDVLRYAGILEQALQNETRSLKQKLQDAELDLADATRSRRELQQTNQTLEAALTQLRSTIDENERAHPYVAVLVDGDGLLFQDAYVRDGLEGGKRAAHALLTAVLNACGDLASKFDVVVKVCANQTGLANAMVRAGIIASDTVFKQFCIGFSQSRASFDFVDVGHGKERADSKIRESTRWHLKNINCKMVLLGISHDAGYAPFLDELRSDAYRLTILEGFPIVRELASLALDRVSFNNLFRTEKITVDRQSFFSKDYSSSTNGVNHTNGTNGINHNGTAMDSIGRLKTRSPPVGKLPAPAVSPTKPKPTEIVVGPVYATPATRTDKAPEVQLPAATKKLVESKKAAAIAQNAAKLLDKSRANWNPGPHGLDPPATYNPTAIESVKRRKGSEKFCNSYVLCGSCPKDYCEYNHKLKPTPDEKKALVYLMRMSPCTFGPECVIDDCIYGHNCPSVRDGQCFQQFCRFPSKMHPPNTKFKQPFYGDD